MTSARIALAAAVLLALQVAGFHSLRHDDAFITYRYGQNIVRGRGVTFNPGDRQMVSSSPAHVVTSAAVYGVVGQEHTPSVMSGLGCVGWIAQALAVLVLARMAFPTFGAVFMALGLALGAAWSQRFVALETNLAAAGVLWALVACLHRRYQTAVALAAVAGLLRADAYLVAVPIAVCCVRDLGWRALKPAAWGVAISTPWYVFAVTYFGTVLPASYTAKVQTVALGPYAEAVAHYVSASVVLGRPELQIPRLVAPGVTGASLTVLSVLVWLGAAAGALLWMRRHPRVWVLPGTGLLYLGAYLLLRARIGIEWHLYPVLLVLAILLLALITEGAIWLRRWRPSTALGPALGPVLGPVLGTALLIAVLTGLAGRTTNSALIHQRAFWYGARHQAYRTIAHQLKRRARPDDVVLVGEVGTLAYYTDLRMVDAGGLIRSDKRTLAGRLAPRWAVSVAAYPLHPCPGPPVLRAVSAPVATAELKPRNHQRFVAILCDLSRPPKAREPADHTPPQVTRFEAVAEPTGRCIRFDWSATDDQSLGRVELWRAPDHHGKPDPKRWRVVPSGVRPLTGRRASGQLRDVPPPGRWWYGVHVLDTVSNIGYEPSPLPFDQRHQ